MRFAVLSDIHAEEGKEYEKYLENIEDVDILVLAGDICTVERIDLLEDLLMYACENYAHVIWVPGNHEYRGVTCWMHMDDELREVAERVTAVGNGQVHFLNASSITVNDMRFIGATLWTNAGWDRREDRDAHIPANVRQRLHYQHLAYLARADKRNAVVITHHPPFDGPRREFSEYYYNTLESLTRDVGVWVYGHLHDGQDLMIGTCRVVCNPVGMLKEARPFRYRVVDV